jgi:hypothetical protein
MLRQRAGQGGGHVAQAAGLEEIRHFRGGEQDPFAARMAGLGVHGLRGAVRRVATRER